VWRKETTVREILGMIIVFIVKYVLICAFMSLAFVALVCYALWGVVQMFQSFVN
jgi:hypothetical protein